MKHMQALAAVFYTCSLTAAGANVCDAHARMKNSGGKNLSSLHTVCCAGPAGHEPCMPKARSIQWSAFSNSRMQILTQLSVQS
jgi:hypothetical protein